jgi:hypothetical protein
MKTLEIKRVESADRRFTLHDGAGSDAVHSVEQYAFACTRLCTGTSVEGFGITLTLGQGNQLVCEAIEQLSISLIGFEIEDLMRNFGSVLPMIRPCVGWVRIKEFFTLLYRRSSMPVTISGQNTAASLFGVSCLTSRRNNLSPFSI